MNISLTCRDKLFLIYFIYQLLWLYLLYEVIVNCIFVSIILCILILYDNC